MSGGGQVVQTGRMTEKKSGHRVDLNIHKSSWKCLSRLRAEAYAGRWGTVVRHEEIHL
jgi:hypothetical protein